MSLVVLLAAILAMRYNKLIIFLGSITSLIIMTVVSALLGFGVNSLIPPIYTFYASVVIMFLFGFKMFWDAYRYSKSYPLHLPVPPKFIEIGGRVSW
jgi:putative Ca2+/H+ antiporter (TMEM165/GDT1 family)